MKVSVFAKQYSFEDERPFPSCHASTLVVLPGGKVLAAWFGGAYEKASDVAIWMSHRHEGNWSKPYKIADEEGVAHWNPVLYAEGERVWLFYKVGVEIPAWHTRIMQSEDGGRTWTAPRELVPGDIGGRGPVRNKPIRLQDGTWIAPASVERRLADEPGKEIWEAFVDRSPDEGRTWMRSEMVPMDDRSLVGTEHGPSKGLIQPTLWTSGGSRVHMLLRSTEGFIYRSDSEDSGLTWGMAYRTVLPNNNSGIDAVLTDSGLLALVFNPISGYTTDSPRTPLAVCFSSDNGMTWGEEFVLEDEPGEYSYPAVIACGDELLITYTWRRERIAFYHLKLTR
ncbi:putative neuraminidase [Paenibacillus phyllosphaerae]|uniref:Putative neuraminidase n=1 Tax=Paenibacillus phyllosphaerae TaxID=274593 RepID=A0A7W5AVW2_9BACL|nr:sialidase family protein [Paenibacillus phyllosphaerae]MBB3109673.1 putative neuraminidase [Paenibacillus phyllosphaerae]